MKAESFIQMLNDIPDAYIDEYGALQENRQRKTAKDKRKRQRKMAKRQKKKAKEKGK